jgi:hypothetical protein
MIGDAAPFLSGGLGIVLSEGGGDEGGDDASPLRPAWARPAITADRVIVLTDVTDDSQRSARARRRLTPDV